MGLSIETGFGRAGPGGPKAVSQGGSSRSCRRQFGEFLISLCSQLGNSRLRNCLDWSRICVCRDWVRKFSGHGPLQPLLPTLPIGHHLVEKFEPGGPVMWLRHMAEFMGGRRPGLAGSGVIQGSNILDSKIYQRADLSRKRASFKVDRGEIAGFSGVLL